MEATVRVGHAPAVVVALQPGERLTSEAGAMMFISGDISMEVEMPGGLMGGLKRKILAGESLFLTRYRGERARRSRDHGAVPRLDPAARARRRDHLREARLPRPPR